MTASEMILVSRRSRTNRIFRKYDIGQVVSLKPTGQTIGTAKAGILIENGH